MKIINIELEGFEPGHLRYDPDYWCDIYASYAEWEDGTPLNDEELDHIPDDILQEEIINQLY